MIDPLDPLLTFLVEHPDHDAQDTRQEIDRLFQRQRAIDRLLKGKISAGELLDLIDSHGIDAAHYADCAISNLHRAVNERMVIDPREAVFYGLD